VGQILSLANLRAYTAQQQRGTKPTWPIAEMLYQRVPVLAYRDYLNNYVDKQWPLCWERRRIAPALNLAGNILKGWQAFRPFSSRRIVRSLEPRLPRIVLQLQDRLRSYSINSVTCLGPTGGKTAEVLVHMARAVSSLARAKHVSNPMLGSKILGFFFPDFFPIWDTAWVKKALAREEMDSLPAAVHVRLRGDEAGLEYARYVHLMLADAWNTSNKEYERLRRECIRECRRSGYYASDYVIDEYFNDLTPVIFEACLLARLK
jgi:hypothetical protein